MFGSILRVAVGAAEFLFDLPVAVAGWRAPRLGAPHDGAPYLCQVTPDVGGPARGDTLGRLEERGALCEIGDCRCVLTARILDVGIGCRHQYRGVDVYAAERPVGRMLVADERLQRLGVAAQDGERRVVRRTALRIPLAAVDIDQPARTLHVDDVDAVRTEQCDVDLEHIAVLPELEVVDDGIAVRQMVAQVGDCLPFGLVDRLADCDHLGH